MFQRKPLRDDVRKEILNRIVDGRLAAGSRINETHLAADLGLSRTPLREAMITLVARGFLKSDMGRGFANPALDPVQFREIQAMLGKLEPFALSGANTLSPQTVMELNNLVNRARLKMGRDPIWPQQAEALTLLVFQWSNLLMSHCRNLMLQTEIERLQGLASRYWYSVARQGFPFEDLLASYTQFYELLRSGRTEDACGLWSDQTNYFSEAATNILMENAAG
jgi:DNA-binding GntR family transcriptional regulator